MPFKPGQSGNPAGRPKRDPNTPTDYSVREAIKRVVRSRPDLLEDTIERLLRGSRSSLGMLELAAKLNRELQVEGEGNRIAIVFTGSLNPKMLKQVDAKVITVGEEHIALQRPEDVQTVCCPQSEETQPEIASGDSERIR